VTASPYPIPPCSRPWGSHTLAAVEVMLQILKKTASEADARPPKAWVGKKAIQCKWIFKRKKKDMTLKELSRYKSRLVAKGFSQILLEF
jgi:hypothetical protein